MNAIFFIVEDAPEGGYTAKAPKIIRLHFVHEEVLAF